jgi:transketolase
MRLAALMGIPVIYVMTHDSIGLGEDGPTHQPVEQLASFRAMPHMCVLRPGDANETVQAWKAALERKSGPTLLVLTRQKLPVLDRSVLAGAEGARRGAYVLSPEKAEPLGVILIASGSELQLALGAQEALEEEDVHTRVVSMPSWELFREQGRSYQEAVLPPQVQARVSIEAGSAQGWREWIGQQGEAISVEEFGASAPYEDILAHYGFTVDSVVDRARRVLAGATHLEQHQVL